MSVTSVVLIPDSQELVIEFDDKPVEYQFGELDQVTQQS